MNPGDEGQISAQVILRSSEEMSDAEARDCERYFREAGFDLGYRFAGSFSITAPMQLFEQVFACELRSDEAGIRVAAGQSTGEYELPLERLSEFVRDRVRAVAFSPPPSFGPVDFQHE